MIMNNPDKGDPDNELVVYNVPPGSLIKGEHSNDFFEAAHDAQSLVVEPGKELYILDNCNPGEFSYTKTSRVIPIDTRTATQTDLLTQHIKDEYPLLNSTMSDLVKVETYIEKVYTDDHPVHDPKRLFHEKFRIMYIDSINPPTEIEFIENFIKEHMNNERHFLRSELIEFIFRVMHFNKINLYDLSCSGLVDRYGELINRDESSSVGPVSLDRYGVPIKEDPLNPVLGPRSFYSTPETNARAKAKQKYFTAKGGQSRKHKSRKHKSRKHKSRKHKSRKHNKSRKHKSRK